MYCTSTLVPKHYKVLVGCLLLLQKQRVNLFKTSLGPGKLLQTLKGSQENGTKMTEYGFLKLYRHDSILFFFVQAKVTALCNEKNNWLEKNTETLANSVTAEHRDFSERMEPFMTKLAPT